MSLAIDMEELAKWDRTANEWCQRRQGKCQRRMFLSGLATYPGPCENRIRMQDHFAIGSGGLKMKRFVFATFALLIVLNQRVLLAQTAKYPPIEV